MIGGKLSRGPGHICWAYINSGKHGISGILITKGIDGLGGTISLQQSLDVAGF